MAKTGLVYHVNGSPTLVYRDNAGKVKEHIYKQTIMHGLGYTPNSLYIEVLNVDEMVVYNIKNVSNYTFDIMYTLRDDYTYSNYLFKWRVT